MERNVFQKLDTYCDHEPGSNVSLIINGLKTRFMESSLFEIDLLTGHEPGIPGGETPPFTAGGTPAATNGRFMGTPVGRRGGWLPACWTDRRCLVRRC